jgi:hypothetical protein
MESTTEKRPAGLIERPIGQQIVGRTLDRPLYSVTASALLQGESESKIPITGQKRPPETPDLEPFRGTINSVDYYHCVYELLYRLIESSIGFVPTLSPSYGAPNHETPITA